MLEALTLLFERVKQMLGEEFKLIEVAFSGGSNATIDVSSFVKKASTTASPSAYLLSTLLNNDKTCYKHVPRYLDLRSIELFVI
jgi:predicted PP-loop superfamily ATPase